MIFYFSIGFNLIFNIVISVIFGVNLDSIDTDIALLIVNLSNLVILIYELYFIVSRREMLIKYRGYLICYGLLPSIALWNWWKENDILQDLIFINELKKSPTEINV